MSSATRASASLILTIPQAAPLIGLTPIATRRAIQRGQLPARKLGGRVVILRAELLAFLEQLPVHPDAAAVPAEGWRRREGVEA